MKKRILSLVLASVMVLSLCACGSSNDKKKEDSTKTENTETVKGDEDSEEIVDGIRKNGELPGDIEDFTEDELKFYLNDVITAAIELDLEKLEEYLYDEGDLEDFQNVVNNKDYQAMWKKTIGETVYLKNSIHLVGKSPIYVFSKWYTDQAKMGAELPEDVYDLTMEQVDDIYEKYYKDAIYVAEEVDFEDDMDIHIEDGKIKFEIDGLFESLGYETIGKMADYGNYANGYVKMVFGEQGQHLDFGYDYITKEPFDIYPILLSGNLEEMIELIDSRTEYTFEVDDLSYGHAYHTYYKNDSDRVLIKSWMEENVESYRDESSVFTFVKANIEHEDSYPFYNFTDKEKELIKDLPIYVWEGTYEFDNGKSDEWSPYYEIVEQMLYFGELEEK